MDTKGEVEKSMLSGIAGALSVVKEEIEEQYQSELEFTVVEAFANKSKSDVDVSLQYQSLVLWQNVLNQFASLQSKAIASREFYFISININIPVEIAMVKFSFTAGIGEKFHTYVDPGE